MGSTSFIAKKAKESFRLCVDYQKLNQMAVKNKYPFPCIDGLFDQLRGFRYIFKIDLRSRYHQLRIKE